MADFFHRDYDKPPPKPAYVYFRGDRLKREEWPVRPALPPAAVGQLLCLFFCNPVALFCVTPSVMLLLLAFAAYAIFSFAWLHLLLGPRTGVLKVLQAALNPLFVIFFRYAIALLPV